jgi:UDP-glucose 4-epimerase
MRVLVTGGAGYIGSVSVRMLLEAGHDVVVLDSLERGYRRAVDERAEFAVGNVGDRAMLDRVMPNVDAVLHLAGYIEVAESMAHPGRYYENNVARPLEMLQAMARHKVRSIVFSSTAAVYGEPKDIPIREQARVAPINAYGASKATFEDILTWFERAHDFRVVRLRYFNVAGAWPDGSIGEAHEPETHVVPRILDSIAAGRKSFEVYGGDYPTDDSTCVRDYIHVMDLGDAHRLALEYVADGKVGGLFNLGNGRGYSNLQVVRTCGEVTGTDLSIDIGPRRPGDPAMLVASNDLARETLGWSPKRGDLSEIVADAWAWRQAHPDGYR